MNFFQFLIDVFFGHKNSKPKPHQTESGNLSRNNSDILISNLTMIELVKKIADTNYSLMIDLKKFANDGNKTAGKRARKTSLELEKLLKEFRKRSVHETPNKD